MKLDTETVAVELVRSLRRQGRERHALKSADIAGQNSYAAHYLARLVAMVVNSPKRDAKDIITNDLLELMGPRDERGPTLRERADEALAFAREGDGRALPRGEVISTGRVVELVGPHYSIRDVLGMRAAP